MLIVGFKYKFSDLGVTRQLGCEDSAGLIGLEYYDPYSDDEDVQLKDQHIMTVLTPDKKLQNEYNKVYGSGLIMPDADRIIH